MHLQEQQLQQAGRAALATGLVPRGKQSAACQRGVTGGAGSSKAAKMGTCGRRMMTKMLRTPCQQCTEAGERRLRALASICRVKAPGLLPRRNSSPHKFDTDSLVCRQ